MIEYPPKPEPIRVEIEPTNICNARCVFCPRYNIRRPFGFLDLIKLSDFLSRLYEFKKNMWINNYTSTPKYPRLVFAGIGEPTLHPQIIDIIKMSQGYGFDTELVTNGSRLDEKLAYEIAEAGLYRLSISLHSLDPKIYYNLMSLKLENVLPRISAALKILDDTEVDIEIWRVSYPNISQNEEREREMFQEFLSRYKKNIRILGPTMAWNRGGQLQLDYHQYTNDGYPIWCQLLYFTFNISWDGRAVLCCCDYSSLSVPLGNAWEESIENIQERRYSIFKDENKPPLCTKCRKPLDNTYEKDIYPKLISR